MIYTRTYCQRTSAEIPGNFKHSHSFRQFRVK